LAAKAITASTTLGVTGTTTLTGVATLTANPVLSAGTANGVTYLNGSKSLTSGSAITFDGTNFATTGTATATKLIPTGTSVTGNGLYLPAANALGLSTNGTNAVYIDSSQNVGIGGTPASGHKLNIIGTAATTLAAWGVTGTTTSGSFAQFINTGNTTIIGVESSAGASLIGGTSAYASIFGTSSAASVQFVTNNSTRTTIDSSGNFLVGTTVTPTGATGGSGFIAESSSRRTLLVASTSTSAIALAAFINPNGTVGTIQTSGSATSYVTSSDYRLKNSIAPMTGALAKVTLLKPCTYKWNVDGSDGQGFIAHELQEVVPECVTGAKDAVETYTDKDGNEATRQAYQGIDTSFLVATLTAAIQEQQALITALTARITALETAP